MVSSSCQKKEMVKDTINQEILTSKLYWGEITKKVQIEMIM